MSKSKNLYTFPFSISIILGNSAFHFLEMIMLNSYVGILNQTRIWVGSITFHRMGPMRGQRMSSVCPNPEMFMHWYFQILYWVAQPLIFLR